MGRQFANYVAYYIRQFDRTHGGRSQCPAGDTGLCRRRRSTQPNNANNVSSNLLTFTLLPPSIKSLSPASVPAGSAAFTLTVTGASFVAGSQVSFRGTPLTTTFVNAAALTTTVPANLLTTLGGVNVQVTNPGGSVSPAASFTVTPAPLSIATVSLPAATSGSNYSALLTGRGGISPYTWTANGLPAGVSINQATGVLSGVPQATGTYVVSVVLTDGSKATANAQFSLVVSPPPVSIAPSSSVPSGVVGVAYTGFIFANGGTEPYTFSLESGSLPDGLTLSSGGVVSGTPKAPGRSSFSVVVKDANRRVRLRGLQHHHQAGAAEYHRRASRDLPHRHSDQHHVCGRRRSGSVPLHPWREPAAGYELLQRSAVRHPNYGGSIRFHRHAYRQHRRGRHQGLHPDSHRAAAHARRERRAERRQGGRAVRRSNLGFRRRPPYSYSGSGLPGRPEPLRQRQHQRYTGHRRPVLRHRDRHRFQRRHGERHSSPLPSSPPTSPSSPPRFRMAWWVSPTRLA